MVHEVNDLEFEMVVPKFSNDGKKIKSEKIEQIAEGMAEEFGGVTIKPSVLGCWKDEEHGLICEENVKLSSALDTENPDSPSRSEAQRFMERKAGKVGEKFGQAAVMTQENKTEVEFIEGEFSEDIPEDKTGRNPFNELV